MTCHREPKQGYGSASCVCVYVCVYERIRVCVRTYTRVYVYACVYSFISAHPLTNPLILLNHPPLPPFLLP